MATKSILKGRPGRSHAGDAVNALLLIVAGAFMLLPMVFVVSNAFKPLDELFVYPPRLFVRNPTWDNFAALGSIFTDSWVPFSRYIFNTVFITAASTLGRSRSRPWPATCWRKNACRASGHCSRSSSCR